MKNNKEKTATVMAKMPNVTKKEAQKMVYFINWMERWDLAIQLMYKRYQIDTSETKTPFIAFCEFIYNQDKTLPKYYILTISKFN